MLVGAGWCWVVLSEVWMVLDGVGWCWVALGGVRVVVSMQIPFSVTMYKCRFGFGGGATNSRSSNPAVVR